MHAALVALSLAVASAPAHAADSKIVGGIATTRHPAVGAVLQYDNGGYGPVCTATLVGPRWVITTASCAAVADAVAFGNDLAQQNSLEFHPVTAVAIDPGAAQLPESVALLELAETPSMRPLVLDLRPIVPADVGLRGIMVGFGRTSYANEASFGVKREAAAVVTSLDDDYLIATRSSPNACVGDSGGPLLVDGRVIGVIAFGAGQCNEFTAFRRMDRVAEFLQATAPVCTVKDPCTRVFADRFED